ncbi:hypothetical protein ACUTAF_02445 [Pseudomonas sp. SP16.1]|uniref:hypothetical protein n=1 Tax=Pseudomonas sp. SP16.1 TaxID=3458854 RepID=UPI004045FC63
MSGKRIGARPLTDPQAESWIHQGAALDSARLTLNVTSSLHTHVKLAAFERGVTMAEMLREVLKQQATS